MLIVSSLAQDDPTEPSLQLRLEGAQYANPYNHVFTIILFNLVIQKDWNGIKASWSEPSEDK
jgi:hypothetical protein